MVDPMMGRCNYPFVRSVLLLSQHNYARLAFPIKVLFIVMPARLKLMMIYIALMLVVTYFLASG